MKLQQQMEKALSSKFQVPKKFQIPSSRSACNELEFEVWSFFGTWNLGFGISSPVISIVAGFAVLFASSAIAASAKKEIFTNAPSTFAPLPANHELASLWNDPVFARRLVGSYGFASDTEPRMTPEEQMIYRDKIVPLLRDDPKK